MSTPLPTNLAHFTPIEVVEATGGRLRLDGKVGASVLSTDSRTLVRGCLYVALVGERFDGHAFVAAALEGGASIVVSEARPELESLVWPDGVSHVVVPDTLVALGALAGAHRARWSGTLVAIAGSAGKTTTRATTTALLDAIFPGRVHATRGNLNNRVGVPLTLLSLDDQTDFAVVEIGTNQVGEVALLAAIAHPDVALLTLIDLEHTEGLGDLDGVEREERALFDALGPHAVALGNLDDARVSRLLAEAKCAHRSGYGRRSGGPPRAPHELVPTVEIVEREVLGVGSYRIHLSVAGRPLAVDTPLPGAAGALAVAAAVLVAETLSPGRVNEFVASRALGGVVEPGRGRVITTASGVVVIDDTYNSNPASARAGILSAQELAQHLGGHLFLALGDMLELGALTESAHQELGRDVAAAKPKRFVAVGSAMHAAEQVARGLGVDTVHVSASSGAAPHLTPHLRSGDVVLVKASRSIRAEIVVDALVSGLGGPGEQHGADTLSRRSDSNPVARSTT